MVTRVDRRLSELEDRVAQSTPPAISAELQAFGRALTHAELDALERIFRDAAEAGRDLTALERLRVDAITAAVRRRQLGGEPTR